MDEFRVNRLATYNSERGRGLLHKDEWVRFMQEEQEEWGKERFAEMAAQGGEEVAPGVWFVPAPPKKRWWLR
jgi:hypothetical protein